MARRRYSGCVRGLRGSAGSIFAAVLSVCLAGVGAESAGGADLGFGRDPAAAVRTNAAGPAKTVKKDGPIEAMADSVDYDKKTGIIVARGNVLIKRGDQELRADQVTVNSNTEDVEARGNCILTRGDGEGEFKSESLKYNFKTRLGDSARLRGNVPPFRIQAEHPEITPTPLSGNAYVLNGAMVTTCSNEFSDSHYHVSARKLKVVPGEYVEAEGATIYMGVVPVMYMPYWHRNLDGEDGFTVYPGYTSPWGGFLLSSYRYRINPLLRGETHVDYRTKRGVGLGQDFKWAEKNPTNTYKGELDLYYVNDKEPFDEADDESLGVKENRYRAKLLHVYPLGMRDNMILQAEYVSDRDLREDFFERDYRNSAAPENFMSYTHRSDSYTMNFLLRSRLNNFYEGVDRMPELSVNFMRQPIGDTVLYYEGRTAGSFLQRVFDKANVDAEKYSEFRFDSAHMVYYPDKYFGWLNIIPRAGYRGTYFSETRSYVTNNQTRVTITTNTVVDAAGQTNSTVAAVTQTNSIVHQVKGPSAFRSKIEFGTEASYNAFKSLGEINGLMYRHVATPYINYTVVPEPNVLPDRLNQFDEVDTYGQEHWMRIGLRNKLQVKEEKGPFSVVDVDIYTRVLFFRNPEQGSLDRFYLNGEMWPHEALKLKFDGQYNTDASEVDIFNTRAELVGLSVFKFALEDRFAKDQSNLISWDVTLSPNSKWDFNVFGRYEGETARVQEEGGFIRRNLDCMSIRVGGSFLPGYTQSDGTIVEKEYRAMLELWLTAFPEVGISGRVY